MNVFVAAVAICSGAKLDCSFASALPAGHLVVPSMTLLLKVKYLLLAAPFVRAEVFSIPVLSCESVMLVDSAAVVSWPGPVE